MAIRGWRDFGEYMKSQMGEEPSEDDLKMLEDFDDTIKDYEERNATDWKAKYEENDKEWKRKYTERFFNKAEEPEPESVPDKEEVKTFSDLFTVKED